MPQQPPTRRRIARALFLGAIGGAWLALVTTGPRAQAQALVVNEMVAANHTGIEDEDGDRPDWIELYNTTPFAASAAGYGLTDDAKDAFKWRLPAVVVPGHGRLLVFASGKDRTNAAAPLHSNFSISAAGERIVLTAPNGAPAGELPAWPVPRDVAIGRLPDGSTNIVFLARPTPKSANTAPGYSAVSRMPAFSFAGGFFENPFSVALSTPDPGTVIRFTLDGSEPVETSPLYAGPIPLTDRNAEPNILSLIRGTATVNQHTDGWFPPSGLVAKATSIRARAFRPGAMPSEVATRTWFIGTNSPTRFQVPVLSLVTDTNGLFDYVRGIYVLGKIFDDYRAAHPAEPLTGHTPANYQGRGDAWTRPAHLEFFLPDGSRAFERDVLIDIQGQSTRSFRQKSLGVRSLGADFDFEIFPGLRGTGSGLPVRQFSNVRLRNAGNDWAYSLLRDGLSHELSRGIGIDVIAYRPSVVFLDGEFWGIHEIREQQDSGWVESHYGVPKSEVVICQYAGNLAEGRPGDELPFAALREYIRTNDLTKPAVAAHVESQMDVDNFLRYHAAEIYLGNADWPHNNIRFWRRRTPSEEPAAPPGHDGRWRWMMFDVDLGYAHPWSGGVGENSLVFATSPSGRPGIDAPWSTVILRQLLKAQPYRNRFISLMADLLNSNFRETRATATVDSMVAALTPAMPEHIRRWRTMDNSMSGWSNNLRVVRQFASLRPAQVRQHVASYFGLGGVATLNFDASPREAGRLRVNSLDLEPGTPGVDPSNPLPWRGTYFRNVPVVIEAIPRDGWVFAGWEGVPTPAPANPWSLTLTGTTNLVARFEPARLSFTSWSPPNSAAGTLRFNGAPNLLHTLQTSDDLIRWTDTDTAQADSSGAGVFQLATPPAETGRSRFFRIVRN